jgi:acyl carrier protein
MNQDQIKSVIIETLLSIAPEVDPATIEPNEDLREQCDLDSMDFLNLVIGLHESLNIDIPETDYSKLATLEGAIAYLGDRSA